MSWEDLLCAWSGTRSGGTEDTPERLPGALWEPSGHLTDTQAEIITSQ